MELKGKKIAFLGDSITEGVGASKPENRFTDVFGRLSGATVYNHGISGTRIAPQRDNRGEKWDEDFILRADEIERDADAVVIFGGTNDFGHGDAPMGELGDKTPDTFYGALYTLFGKLIACNPQAQFVVMTPLHRMSEDEIINERGLPRRKLVEYVSAIRAVAEYYSFPVLDLWASSGLQPHVDVIREKMMPDGLHPSDPGHARIAERLYNFMKSL